MTEMLLYTAAGIVLYVISDAVLRFIESRYDEPLQYRSVIFFGIILALALILFAVIRAAFG
ncbi:MAG: hypothetical protein O2780_01410 [Proteobacteria bacterium]|jgi:hypothetical protein|nr:hypothetical protein [Pseudomonadota bacterium]MDA1299503.1 hypothetical protein [Pseudomonadota bacterium]